MGQVCKAERTGAQVWTRRFGLLFFGFLLAVVGHVLPSGTSSANAYDSAAFNPGNIIDDALFYNGQAMSAEQVQQFLEQRVTRCTLGDPGRPPGGWGAVSTASGPVSVLLAQNCLRSTRVTTETRPANAYCAAYIGAVNETAAQVIAKIGAACGVSQKVLLVMLEKEQSLVTDTWPSQRQMDVAMGYACPDSGPGGTANCDPTQTGFFKQVYRAAWQLKVYLAHPTNYGYRPGWNTINWQVVERGCGTSSVYIENWATAALYIYTPYRPNEAALAAGWGTGDYCSTYGNRNFVNFYKSWFGALHATPHVLGDLNSAAPTSGGLAVRGWAADQKSPTMTQGVQFYMGNLGWQLTANQSRPDVPNVYPQFGSNVGFNATLPGVFSGRQQVCAYATVQLGCTTVDFGVAAPIGALDPVTFEGNQVVVKGWGVDADYSGSLDVHVYIGTRSYATKAQLVRAGTPSAYGSNRGFEWRMNAAQWAGSTQRVCAYGINVTPSGAYHGNNSLLASCRDVTFPLNLADTLPTGELETVEYTRGKLIARGWAMDPDVSAPVPVIAKVSGSTFLATVDQDRADGRRGFIAEITPDSSWPTLAEVCAEAFSLNAMGTETGASTGLGCKSIAITPDVDRQWAQTSFGAAAAVALSKYPAPETVYIASAHTYTDALAAGPIAAADQAPLLLVDRGVLPEETRNAISQMNPSRIVIVGGPNSVFESVRAELQNLTRLKGAESVDRQWAQTSFGAAAAVALSKYPAPETVYIASAHTYTDALAAGPIAAADQAPLLLVDRGVLPEETRNAISQMNPSRIVIVGGPNSVFESVRRELQSLTRSKTAASVDRQWAQTSFGAAAAVALSKYPAPETVYIASAHTYTDALAAGPIAAADQAPLLLVDRGVLPEETRIALSQMNPSRIVIVGGPNSVFESVRGELQNLTR